MAKAILLDTKTVNFLELIGNGKTFEVPPFQRDYSWTQENWDDFWADTVSLRANPDDRHYMGAVVVLNKSDRHFRIIDGQQRIATLSIFALAVIAQLGKLAARGVDPDDNRERAASLRNSFIGQKDPVSLFESSKLSLNVTDRSFYQDNLVQLRPPLNPKRLPKSNRLLWECFQFFSKTIDGDAELAGSGEELARLLNEVVARRLLFILISVDDEMNAYTVFETLNARGLGLSPTDLLKNYLFSRFQSEADLQALERRWQQLIAIVRQERFSEFLRYHLLCEHRSIRQQQLFKLMREKVKTPEDVISLMNALESRGEAFNAFFDADHEYWDERPECKPLIRELGLFGVKQMTPLLFAAWEKFEPPAFVQVLKLIVAVSFRYNVVGARNTNELEPVYHDAAKSVLTGKASRPSDAAAALKSIYLRDSEFRNDFSFLEIRTQGSRKRLAKYILCKLEAGAAGRPIDWERDPATIEHILPENPSPDWEESFPAESWDSSAYRLGNLTLLEASRNRGIGNRPYGEKIGAYSESSYAITRAVPERNPDAWTMELLQSRQEWMAGLAAQIWRFDGAS
jgi:hypothetical protein